MDDIACGRGEMVDAQDLKSWDLGRVGSSPTARTNIEDSAVQETRSRMTRDYSAVVREELLTLRTLEWPKDATGEERNAEASAR